MKKHYNYKGKKTAANKAYPAMIGIPCAVRIAFNNLGNTLSIDDSLGGIAGVVREAASEKKIPFFIEI